MEHPKAETKSYMAGLSIDTDMINIGVDETLLTHPASIFRWNVLMAFYRISNLLTDGYRKEESFPQYSIYAFTKSREECFPLINPVKQQCGIGTYQKIIRSYMTTELLLFGMLMMVEVRRK